MNVVLKVWRMKRGQVARAAFPPQQIAEVKAVACDPPSEGCLVSRRSPADVHRLVLERGICDALQSMIVRWLREDALRPWHYRSWIFATDPEFAQKGSASRLLPGVRFCLWAATSASHYQQPTS